jgi:cytochrome c2
LVFGGKNQTARGRGWLRRAAVFGSAAAGAAFLALAFAFAGNLIGRHALPSNRIFIGVENFFLGARVAEEAEAAIVSNWAEETSRIDTIFLSFDADIGFAPVSSPGAGGGLAPFGQSVIVLAHDGAVFAASSSRDIRRLRVETPDNGLAAYRALAATPEGRAEGHQPSYLRFNDIRIADRPQGRTMFVSYSEYDPVDRCFRNVVSGVDLPQNAKTPDDLVIARSDWRVIFRAEPCLPFKSIGRPLDGHLVGGRMIFESPDRLILTSGDYGWDGVFAPDAISQLDDYDYGKIIEIDLSTGASRHISTGHRNMQGVAFDTSGALWAVEHGHRGGDELNLIHEGANYGWPLESLGTRYNGLPLPQVRHVGRHDDFAAPVYAWLPSIAPSNLILINNFSPEWDGDFLLASLRDASLYRLRIAGGSVQFAERIPIGRRVRYVAELADGRLVLWTDDFALVFLSIAKREADDAFVARYLETAGLNRAARRKLTAAIEICTECHTLKSGAAKATPALGLVFGAPVASSVHAEYSAALRARGGLWTRKALTSYIKDPQGYVPGTTMPDPGIDDPETIENLAKFLETLRTGD